MARTDSPERWRLSFIAALLVLSLCGLALIYSAGQLNLPSPVTGMWIRQGVFLAAGVVGFILLSRIPARWIQWAAMPSYVASVGVLAVTLAIGSGAGTAAGVNSFLSVAGFRFQPAEAAKVTTALALAWMLFSRLEPPGSLRDLIKPTALVSLPMLLVVLQPDLGTALAFVGIYFAALFWAGTPWQILVLAASPGVALLLAFDVRLWSGYMIVLAVCVYLYRYGLELVESFSIILASIGAGTIAQPLWDSLAQYQRNRLLVFLDPGLDPQGAGWQLIQSKVAVGSGGLLGKGFTAGTQKRLNFVPEQHTDFIFSVLGEEFGFVGTSLILLLFGYLFFRMIRMAVKSGNPFAGLFIFGILGAWLTHVCVNVGMTVGVLPITGIPLPFISYGGSLLLMSWCAGGVAVSLASDDS